MTLTVPMYRRLTKTGVGSILDMERLVNLDVHDEGMYVVIELVDIDMERRNDPPRRVHLMKSEAELLARELLTAAKEI